MIGPTSSFSGKNTSMRSMLFSCAIEITRGVISSLASRMTSPVAGLTMSAAANAPSSSASEISIASTLALRSAAMAELVIFLPAWIVMSDFGIVMSLAARSPTRLSLTAQNFESFRM